MSLFAFRLPRETSLADLSKLDFFFCFLFCSPLDSLSCRPHTVLFAPVSVFQPAPVSSTPYHQRSVRYNVHTHLPTIYTISYKFHIILNNFKRLWWQDSEFVLIIRPFSWKSLQFSPPKSSKTVIVPLFLFLNEKKIWREKNNRFVNILRNHLSSSSKIFTFFHSLK